MVRVDTQINYPTSLPGVWEGLPTDFTAQYYAEWEDDGYATYSVATTTSSSLTATLTGPLSKM